MAIVVLLMPLHGLLDVVQREGAKNVYDRVNRVRPAVAVGRKSVDILLLLDVSGSMRTT